MDEPLQHLPSGQNNEQQPLTHDLDDAVYMKKQQMQKQVKKVRKMFLIQLFLDISIICIMVTMMNMTNNILQKQPAYAYARISQMTLNLIITLISNHVQGVFLFVYVLMTLNTFPPQTDMQLLGKTIYILECTTSVLIFISTHLKFIAKQLVRNDQELLRQSIANYIGQKPAASERSFRGQFLQNLNIVFSNLLSVLSQSVIFYFGVKLDVKNDRTIINYWMLYFGIPGLCMLIFVSNYFFSLLINKKFKVPIKQVTNFIIKQIFYFMIIGLFVSVIVNAVFLSWDILNYLFKELPGYPSFNKQAAYQLSVTICSFWFSQSGFFANFLATPAAKVLMQEHELSKKSKFLLFIVLMQNFFALHSSLLISSLIIFGVLTTTKLSDLISLAMALLSGVRDELNGWEIFFNAASFCISATLMTLYVCLIIKQSFYPVRQILLGFITFLVGIFAIPSTLSIKFVQNFILYLLPCEWRSGMQWFLSESIIPFATIISFLQSMPLIFYQQCVPINVYSVKDKIYRAAAQRKNAIYKWTTYFKKLAMEPEKNREMLDLKPYQIKDVNEFNNITLEQLKVNEEDLKKMAKKFKICNYDEAYKASKFVCAPFQSLVPRQTKAFFVEKEKIKKAKKTKAMFIVENKTLYIAIRGTRTMLNLSPRMIFGGLVDWLSICLTSSTQVYLDNSVTWCRSFPMNRAKRIYNILKESDIAQFDKIVISGHHAAGCTALCLAYLLQQNMNMRNVAVYGFGCPHLVSESMVEFVNNNVEIVKFFQVGTDGKLFMSAVLNNQLRWSNSCCVTIPHATTTDHQMGYLAILSTGSTPERCSYALRAVVDKISQKQSKKE